MDKILLLLNYRHRNRATVMVVYTHVQVHTIMHLLNAFGIFFSEIERHAQVRNGLSLYVVDHFCTEDHMKYQSIYYS